MKRKHTSFAPWIMGGIGLLLITLALFLVLNSEQERQRASNQPIAEIPDSAGEQENQVYPEITRVSLEDALAAHETGRAVFVDVRGQRFFDEKHIAGAVVLDEMNMEPTLQSLSKEAWIITYCT